MCDEVQSQPSLLAVTWGLQEHLPTQFGVGGGFLEEEKAFDRCWQISRSPHQGRGKRAALAEGPHSRRSRASPQGRPPQSLRHPRLSSKVVFLTPSAYTLLFSSYGVALEWGLFIIYQKSKINLTLS